MDYDEVTAILAAMPPDAVAKAVLDAAARRAIPASDYAYISSDGGKHLPIHDAAHVRAALARFNQTHFESDAAKAKARAKILAAARRFGIEVSDDANVNKATGSESVRITIAINKADVDLKHGVIFGVASSSRPDTAEDALVEEDMESCIYDFMANVHKANDSHGYGGRAMHLPGDFVASWYQDGVWRIGFRPHDREIAKAAARGEYVGFSIEGLGERVED